MNKRRRFVFRTWLFTLPLVGLGSVAGWLYARQTDPSGWSTLPYTLEAALYAYGFGLGIVAFFRYPSRRTPGVFNRLFFSVLTSFFAVIFFAEPLHLDLFPWLPYALIVLFPLAALDLALRTLRPFRDG